jgi:hypothetical protein
MAGGLMPREHPLKLMRDPSEPPESAVCSTQLLRRPTATPS